MYRRLLLLFLIGLVVPVVACQDLNSPQARENTVADTIRASALNGTPATARSALDVWNHEVLVPNGNLNFDIVFDIENGKPVLIPVSKVAACNRVCQVGLQVVTDSTFDQLTKARPKGYTYDTPITIDIGQPVLIVAKSYVCQGDPYSNDLYAKLVVDSVHAADRSIFFRLVTDVNCGFRSLVPGVIPKN